MPLLTDPSAILSFYLVGLETTIGHCNRHPNTKSGLVSASVERRLDFDVFEVLRDLVLLKGLLTD